MNESGLKDNLEFEQKVQRFYQEILTDFRRREYEISSSEAVFLKQIVRDVIKENNKIKENSKKTNKETMDLMPIHPEVKERFFLYYYGISYHSYLGTIDSLPDVQNDEREAKFFKDILELRKDRELM